MEQTKKMRTIANFKSYDEMLDNVEIIAEIIGCEIEQLFVPYTESKYGGYNVCYKPKLTFIEGRKLEAKVRKGLQARKDNV